MRNLLLVVGVLASLTPANAQVVIPWHGVAKIAAASPQCQGSGWAIGSTLTYVHRPRYIAGKNDLTSNGPDTFLNLYQHFTGQSYQFANRDIRFPGVVNTSAVGVSIRGGWYTFNTTARAGTTTPKVVNSTTDTVSIVLTIDNFFNNIGCTVTLRGAGTRR